MQLKFSLRHFLAIAGSSLLAVSHFHAATLTWDAATGDGVVITDGSGTWSDLLGNWNDGVTDANWANANPDSAVFGGGSAGTFGTVTLGTAIAAGSLTFNTPNGGGAYTIDTSTFGLTLNTGITANESATIQSGVGGSLILGATNAWSVATTKTLTVNSAISGTGFGITKSGAGILTLSNASNSYTGGTSVTAGTLSFVSGALGTTGAITVNGGTLQWASGNTQDISGRLILQNTGSTTLDTNGNNVSLATAFGGGTSSSLIKTGSGTLTLGTAINTYTGGTTVNGGALTLTGPGTGDGTIRGTLTINSGATVNTQSANALGWNTNRVTTLNINGGLLNNTAAGDQGWGITINLTGGELRSNGGTSSSATTQLFSLGGGSAVNTLASATSSTISGRINLRESNPSNTLAFNVADGAAATDLLVSAAITQSATGFGISKSGNGTMVLSGANTYTGTTTVSAGELRLSGSAFTTTAGRTYQIGTGAVMSFGASGTIPTGTATTIQGTGTLRVLNGVAISGGTGAPKINMNLGAGAVIDVQAGGGFGNGYQPIVWTNNQATLNMDGTHDLWDDNAIIAAALIGSGTIASTNGGNTNGTRDFTLGVGNGSGTFSGNITAAGARQMNLIKNGTGTQIFSGSTTFKGTITVNGGTLQYAKTSSLQAGVTGEWVKTKIIVNSGGTIAFNVGGTNEFTTGNVTTLLTGLGGAVTNNGLLAGSTIAFDTTNATGGTFTIADTIASTTGTGGGAVGLTKLGTGTLVLSGPNTFTGNTLVSAGVLQMGNTLALQNSAYNTASVNGGLDLNGNTTPILGGLTGSVNLSSTLITGYGSISNLTLNPQTGMTQTYSGDVGNGNGSMALTKTGAGTQILSGTNTYTGLTSVNVGTLLVTKTAALPGYNAASRVTVASGATLAVNADSGGWTSGEIDTLLGATTAAFTSGSNLGMDVTTGSFTYANDIGVTQAAKGFAKSGAGILVLSGLNTYTGATTISAGTLRLGAAGNATNTPLGTSAAGTTVSGTGTLDLNGYTLGTAEALSIAGSGTSNSGALANTGAAANYSGLVTLGAAARIVAIGNIALTNVGTISGATYGLTLDGTSTNSSIASIIGTTSGALTKVGSGTWTLSGANTYTGATAISVGTLKLGAAGGTTNTPLGTSAAGTTVSGTGTLDLNGFTLGTAEALSIAGSGTSNSGALANTGAAVSYSGLVTLGAAARIVANGNITLTNTGTITGNTFGLTLDGTSTNSGIASIIGTTSGTLTKVGSGTWTLSGANTYTGATAISVGTLKLGAAGGTTNTPLGTTAAGTTVSGTGTLDLNGYTLGTAEALSIAGSGTSNSGALANTGAAANYSGLVTLGATARIVATGNIALTNPGTITGATFGLTLDGTSTNSSIASVIGTTSGTLTKEGAGTWTLSGNNTYSGTTTVNNGTLQIGSGGTSGTLGTGNTTLTSPANLTFNRSDAYTYAGSISGTGSITQTGAGGTTLASSGSLAAGINLKVDAGTLSIAEGGAGRTVANNIVLNGGTVQGVQDNTGTGGTITVSGGNVTHIFTASGTLVLNSAVTSSQLIVGGGGGGGGGTNSVAYNAGGGGGQVLNLTGQAIASGNTTVTVGAGGVGGVNVSGGDGGASSIGGNSAAGGLGAKLTPTTGTGGTSGSGFAGGVKNGTAAGGGGGNAAVGSNPTSGTVGGNGGAGTIGTITGLYYGGGGGGGSSSGTSGTGGLGGGGNGSNGTATAGAANTGGGGGGGSGAGTSAGSTGGSGIAIVQYAYATTAGSVTLSGSIDLQSASTLDAYGSGGILSLNGLISTSAGAGGLTIASSNAAGGVVRFGSANTYVGNTTVNSGATLRMNTTNALPNGSGKGNLNLSGTLDLNGQTTTTLNGLSGSGTIDNNAGAGTYALSVGNNDQTSTFSGVIQNTTGTVSLTKAGNGTLTLSNANTYTGATTVSAGTLFVSGSLTSDVTVSDNATLGGGGLVDDLILGGGSLFDMFEAVTNTDSLTATAVSFAAAGFGIDNLVYNGAAVNWGSIADGTYTLITGTLDETNLGNFGSANAFDLGGGRSAYFQEGSLQLVVATIPEPRAALLGGLGMLMLLRRRRQG